MYEFAVNQTKLGIAISRVGTDYEKVKEEYIKLGGLLSDKEQTYAEPISEIDSVLSCQPAIYDLSRNQFACCICNGNSQIVVTVSSIIPIDLN